MELKEILSKVDHTLLAQGATWEDIRGICDDGLAYGTASVCIPPSYVARAREYLGDRLAVCTVIGFPNGYATTAVKCFETEDAVKNGADEIDMVINIGWVKEALGRPPRGDPGGEGRLRWEAAEGHHRDLPAHRGGEDQDVRDRL